MASAILISAAVLLLLFSTTFEAEAESDLAYDVQILAKLIRGVSWYETVKRMPPRNHTWGPKEFDDCMNHADKLEQQFSENPANPDFWSAIGRALDGSVFSVVHEAYSYCNQYVMYPEAALDKEYYPHEILEDKEEYPYRTMAHCILHGFEDKNGKKALDVLVAYWKEPKTTSFLIGMWNRANELRAFHGVPNLLLDHQLTKQAQLMAEELAEAGVEGVVNSKYHGDQYQVTEDVFEPVGESVVTMEWHWFLPRNADMVGVNVANMWYLESEQYPWPAFKGDGDLKEFARFTQQVWKDTKRVGYGYAVTKGYKDNYYKLVHVVARYWPAGNPTDEASLHLYEENVLPPIESTSS